MLNKIWPFFIIISFIFALLTGNINNFNNSIFDSCTQAVDLIIKLFGTMCLWNGLMKIVQKSSLINKLSNMISPLMKFLFPKMNKEDKEYKEITINIIANLTSPTNNFFAIFFCRCYIVFRLYFILIFCISYRFFIA